MTYRNYLFMQEYIFYSKGLSSLLEVQQKDLLIRFSAVWNDTVVRNHLAIT